MLTGVAVEKGTNTVIRAIFHDFANELSTIYEQIFA